MRAAEQALGDEAVEAADDDGELQTLAAESCPSMILLDMIHFPANAGRRFSRNARVPSRSIFGGGGEAERRGFEAQAFFEPAFEPHIDGLHHQRQRHRPVRQHLAQPLAAELEQLAASTTWFTSPMRCASAASIGSPDSSISSARPRPTSRGSRCVPP